jgi:hypothetical protein
LATAAEQPKRNRKGNCGRTDLYHVSHGATGRWSPSASHPRMIR